MPCLLADPSRQSHNRQETTSKIWMPTHHRGSFGKARRAVRAAATGRKGTVLLPGTGSKPSDAKYFDGEKACIDKASILSLETKSHNDSIDQPDLASTRLFQEADQGTVPLGLRNVNSSSPLPSITSPMNRDLMPSLSFMPLMDNDKDEKQGQPVTLPTQDAPRPNLVLPAIPESPEQPTLPDFSQFPVKDARKQAERDGKRLQKAYDQAIKDRNKTIQER
ncbi:hypothetical protein E4U41_003341 [Claviceps citrina]|nr:hypothetical protein E4U41_003341 [Claviceps citrina]